MKILAIRGKNLASLEGEFLIDFTAEPLRSAGIFAITGSTGAGKSTLLDALCLALFDCTPRMYKAKENNVSVVDVRDRMIAQNDSRSILRRGTAEGYSEVDFVALNGDCFRSRWLVRRSRGKVEGSLQKVEISLLNLTNGREEQGTKTELLLRITELIGLSFEQFSRSVLLAQGDFATFLKARQAEKAEILEKLTGTEIYSRISASIYEKSKKAEAEYKLLQEQIKGVELLDEEQFTALTEERNLMALQLIVCKENKEKLTFKLKWRADEQLLIQACEQATDTLKQIGRELEEVKPRYALLERVEQAQEVRDVFMEWRSAQRQTIEIRKQLTEQEAAKQTKDELCGAMAKQSDRAQQEWKEFKDYLTEVEPQLTKAKELDIQIIESRKQEAETRKELAAALKQKESLTKSMTELEQTLLKLQERWNASVAWFEKYATYDRLVPAVELVGNLLTDWETANAQKQTNEALVNKVKQNCEAEVARLKDLLQEGERLNSLLPSEVVTLRAQLEEGMPCPVCGSLHHVSGKPTDIQTLREEELNRAKEKTAKEIERLTSVIEERRLEIARLTALADSYARQSEGSLEKVTTYVSILPNWEKLLAQGTLKQAVQAFGQQWSERLQEQADLKETLATRRVQGESMKHELEALCRTCEERGVKREAQRAELATREEERSRLLNGEQTTVVALRNAARRQELEQAQEALLASRHALTVEVEAFKVRIAQIQQEIARLDELIRTDLEAITNWLAVQPTNLTLPELEELLLKDRLWIQAEKKFLHELKERETSAQAVEAERKRKRTEHEALPSKPTEDEDYDTLATVLAQCTTANEVLTDQLMRADLVLSNHQQNKQKMVAFEKELAAKTTVYENWSKLNELFGSQTGTKFKEIAQGYTLDVLLLYANRHLQDLAPRYELQRVGDTLALQIVDLDMMGEVRSVHSLSGGESFLVSLALALGLSSLSSNRMNVESLFIDEGFGSLDIDTLRIAMDALECLQMQGRKIGVISHVEEMTERIPTRVQVVKIANGRSRIRVE